MIRSKFISPLYKNMGSDSFESLDKFIPGQVAAGEIFSIQLAVSGSGDLKEEFYIDVDSGKFDNEIYSVYQVPVRLPCYPGNYDDDYLTTKPGLYPDLMKPVAGDTVLYAPGEGFSVIRIEIRIPEETKPGAYSLKIRVKGLSGNTVSESSLDFDVLPLCLERQKTVVMNWFHADCICQYYNIEPMSGLFFDYCRKFISLAVKNGINSIYVPVFTPPLDTEVGGERLTVQLVDISFDKGVWSFSYENLDRWLEMILECGGEYFEICHLYSQWGASHAPKIIARVEGKIQKVFGWETDSSSDEYRLFLRAFLKDFISHMKSLGLDRKCIFHISDEPNTDNIGSYEKAVNNIADLLEDYIVADAVSEEEFYQKGLCRHPIPVIDRAESFLDLVKDNLWIYYCCGPATSSTNRFISMPLSRVRILGIMMWKYRIKGFLHWGYNFYNSQYSRSPVNPYLCTDGEYFAPAGDAFIVYPGSKGEPYPSVRLSAMREAFDDIRFLDAAEKVLGREQILSIVDGYSGNLKFTSYPRGEEYIWYVRNEISKLIRLKQET